MDGDKLESPPVAVTRVPYYISRMDFVSEQDRDRKEDTIKTQLEVGAFRINYQELEGGL